MRMGRIKRSYERLRSENAEEEGEEYDDDDEQKKKKNNPRRSIKVAVAELWKKMDEGKPKLGLPFKSFIATYETMMLCFAHNLVLSQQW